MNVQQMVPQKQETKRLSALWMRVSTGLIVLLALLWRFIAWMWSILIIGAVVGVLGNVLFTLLTTDKIDLTGTLTVIAWLYAHISLCLTILALTLVITLCSYLAHHRRQRASQENQRAHDEALVVVAKGVQRALDELNAKPIALHPSHLESGNQDITPPKVIWNVPYRRNPFFTGREDLLNQLHEYFTRAKTAALTQPPAITGLGGIGKTQIAVEYAYRYKEEYHAVLWISAASRETLIESFVTLARLLALPATDEHDPNRTVTAVQHWLTHHTQWFLILDNADDSTLVRECLPRGDHGHILLTTRERAWGPDRKLIYDTQAVIVSNCRLFAKYKINANLSCLSNILMIISTR